MNLLSEIISEIESEGAMSIAKYMELCLTHPVYGYYMKKDPFGEKGDFITAPEISQMFGEIIAAWCINKWMEIGSPNKFLLVEIGPGRGTLMSDILRVAKKFPDFFEAANIRLLETSPHLIAMQKNKLEEYSDKVEWIDNIDSLTSLPAVFVANEFFDALPIQQFVELNGVKTERKIIAVNGTLQFTLQEEENISEESEASKGIISKLAQHIGNNSGAALVIDYGYTAGNKGDTLQAVKNHYYHSVLETPGDADITAHVDFFSLAETVRQNGAKVQITSQADFLKMNGIAIRAQKLMEKADENQKQDIMADLERLLSPDRMGELFKVMVIE